MNDAGKETTKTAQDKQGLFRKFPAQFWLVIFFEFIERGSYYGMMSFISDYFVGVLHFPKESVGVIKGVIQPLLYFLPILSGAIADRFGYRRMLMLAFALMGGGYFLISQVTSYTAVFFAMVVMGFGAGIFKPIISASIARLTDESNSTQGFGIFYWSINLGAFLFPLFLVPYLKNINPAYVILSAALCTGALLIPTALFYREPPAAAATGTRERKNLLKTLADAFAIIYSPLVILLARARGSRPFRIGLAVLLAVAALLGLRHYLAAPSANLALARTALQTEPGRVFLTVHRDMAARRDFQILPAGPESEILDITVFRPGRLDEFLPELQEELRRIDSRLEIDRAALAAAVTASEKRVYLRFLAADRNQAELRVEQPGPGRRHYRVSVPLADPGWPEAVLAELKQRPELAGLSAAHLEQLSPELKSRSFFPLFLVSLVLLGFLTLGLASRGGPRAPLVLAAALACCWLLPGLSVLGRIICSVIYLSLSSLLVIDRRDTAQFVDHGKFLLMIVLYSGFWILYFQMFDAVLWYVRAYVDAGPLNQAVNSFLGWFGIRADWFFDVEHVTVINAGTIILLQLFISSLVKNRKALPTMISGITIGTLGMAILALSTSIWVFMAGIMIFSIGEMTAHPKFISYIGLVAPPDKKALYQGYLFLYGVFGASVGAVVGARLYVHFVDNLNQPRLLWLIFSGIGLLTIAALLLYNRFLVKKA